MKLGYRSEVERMTDILWYKLRKLVIVCVDNPDREKTSKWCEEEKEKAIKLIKAIHYRLNKVEKLLREDQIEKAWYEL